MIKSTVDHIAFASLQTDKTVEILKILGFQSALFYREPLDKFGSAITKLKSDSGQVIEIVEPTNDKSVVNRLLQKQQATIYHAAFLVDDLDATLTALKLAGVVVISEPMSIPYPATEAHCHYKTCHLFHPHVGLFEITGASKCS